MSKKLKLTSLLMLVLTLASFAGTAQASQILFQDDTFQEVESDALMLGSNDNGTVNTSIQFGNNATSSNNGKITWDITTNSFNVDHSVNVTGGLSATGNVNFSGSSQLRLRESTNPTTLAACSNTGEVIMNTTTNQIQICTATGAAGAATWSNLTAGNADTVDGLHSSSFLRADGSSALTTGTLTTNAGTTLTVNGAANFSNASQFLMRNGATNPATCTKGEMFFNTTTNILSVCTAANTWSSAGPQDFESVFATDADKTLTTGNQNFTVNTGSGNFAVTSTGATSIGGATVNSTSTGATNITAGATSNISTSAGNLGLGATAGNVNVTGGAAANNAINLNASNAAGGITANWGTGGLNFASASGAFSISGAANSTIQTTGTTDLTLKGGSNLLFGDGRLAGIKLSNTATGWAPTLTGGGIIDNINAFTSTSATGGAKLVGVYDSGTNLQNIDGPGTVTDLQDALTKIDSKLGTVSAKNDVLSFAPQYPDTVIVRSGSNNQGTVRTDYDGSSNQYYRWTTNRATSQNIDVRFKYSLPMDFQTTGAVTLQYRTGTATAADNAVAVTVKDVTKNKVCASTTGNVAVGPTWSTLTIPASTLTTGCTGTTALAAGDLMEMTFNLNATAGTTHYTDISTVTHAY